MMLTEKECREALKDLYNSICELEEIKSGVETTCVFDDSLDCFKELIDQHFDNPQIDWLKNCMGEEAFNLIFSSQEEVNKWFDRMRWHVKKCDEYGRELDILKNNPPLKFDELKEGMWVWDNYWEEYFEISEVYSNTKEIDVLIHQNKINQKRYETIKYTPNRFYRKEVQE